MIRAVVIFLETHDEPPELPADQVVPIPGKAGDLLIWNSHLPHGSGRNDSDRLRLAQYMSMKPTGSQLFDQLDYRLKAWRERLFARPAVERGIALGFEKRSNIADDEQAKSVLFGQRASV